MFADWLKHTLQRIYQWLARLLDRVRIPHSGRVNKAGEPASKHTMAALKITKEEGSVGTHADHSLAHHPTSLH